MGMTFGLKLTVPFSDNICLLGVKNPILAAQMALPAATPVRACQRRGPVFSGLMPTLMI